MKRIYEFITARGHLSEEHKQELQVKRGFTEETIKKYRFFSGGDYLLKLEEEFIKSYAQDELIESGVFYIPKGGTKMQISTMLLGNRVIIPYLDAEGKSTLLRPHKLGLK